MPTFLTHITSFASEIYLRICQTEFITCLILNTFLSECASEVRLISFRLKMKLLPLFAFAALSEAKTCFEKEINDQINLEQGMVYLIIVNIKLQER